MSGRSKTNKGKKHPDRGKHKGWEQGKHKGWIKGKKTGWEKKA